MKSLFLLTVGLLAASFSFDATAQVTCYGDESKAADFWLDHFYYAKCTDYTSTGSQLFGGNLDCVEFTAGSSIDFTGINVSKDDTYLVKLFYGIGWCDELGATVDLNVNGEFTDQLILFPSTVVGVDATVEFEVELYADYDNVIQLVNVKDWPAFRGFQLSSKNVSATPEVEENPFTISSSNGILSVDNLNGNRNSIRINSIDGKLIKSVNTYSSSFVTPLATGLYTVNVNGNVEKIFIK